MEVNLKKTKVMIFQKGNKKMTKPSFTLDNKTAEIVQEYCYTYNQEQKLLRQPHKCPPHPQINVV
jgi:hypothetical protein